MAKFGKGYTMQERPSRAEELDARFGLLVVRMVNGVRAFQANDAETSASIEAELAKEIRELDEKVQRELASYVRTLVLEEIVPVATLHYAGPVGRSYLRPTKLVLMAKQLGAAVNPYRYRDTVVGLPQALEALSAEFAGKGLFDRARRAKTLASQIREVTPKVWLEPKTGELEARGIAAVPTAEPEPQPQAAATTDFSDEEKDRIAAAQAKALAASETGTRRSRKWRR
jgi:hypothetical protein